MKLEGEGKLLRLFIGESDTWHGKPLYQAIVERVREGGACRRDRACEASRGSAPTRASTHPGSSGSPRICPS